MVDGQAIAYIDTTVPALPLLLTYNFEADAFPVLASIGYFTADPILRLWARFIKVFIFPIAGKATETTRMPISADLPRFALKGGSALPTESLNGFLPQWMCSSKPHADTWLPFSSRAKMSALQPFIPRGLAFTIGIAKGEGVCHRRIISWLA